MNNDLTRDKVITEAIKNDVIDTLEDISDKYKDDSEITRAANKLLYTLAKTSPVIVEKLGKKDFVKNLIKETKAISKEANNNREAYNLANQNLECLSVLADIQQTADKISNEGGIPLAIGIVKLLNKANKEKPKENEDQVKNFFILKNE